MSLSRSDQGSILPSVALKRFVLTMVLAATISALLFAAIYRQDARHRQVVVQQEAEHVLALQHEFLLVEFQAVLSDLRYLANQRDLSQFLTGDESIRGKLEQEFVSFARSKVVYDQIRYLDATGSEIVRVNFRDGHADVVSPDELQSKATRYYYRQALLLERGNVFVSPFDLNVEHGQIELPIQPVIRFLTPVFDQTGQKRGLLVLNYLGGHLLSRLRQVAATFRGQAMLVNSNGEYLQAPNANHEWGWLLGHDHSFRAEYPAAWKQGEHLDTGQFRVDRNLFTFRRVSPGHASHGKPSVVEEDDQLSGDLVLVSVVASSVTQAESQKLLNQLLVSFAGVLAIVALPSYYWARSVAIRRQHEVQIAESAARLRHLTSLLMSAQEEERRSLSRDLHDELGQQVTAIYLDLRSLQKKQETGQSDPLLQRAIDETDCLLKSLHKIATRVRPSVLDDFGLQDAVESLLVEHEERTGIMVQSDLRFTRQDIPALIGENAYRVLQEALANVASHAHVDRVDVTIATDDDQLFISVSDAGRGFDLDEYRKQPSKRLGILGMRERVDLLNGEFTLRSTPGQGTTIQVVIPLNDEDASYNNELSSSR